MPSRFESLTADNEGTGAILHLGVIRGRAVMMAAHKLRMDSEV